MSDEAALEVLEGLESDTESVSLGVTNLMINFTSEAKYSSNLGATRDVFTFFLAFPEEIFSVASATATVSGDCTVVGRLVIIGTLSTEAKCFLYVFVFLTIELVRFGMKVWTWTFS